MEASAIILVIRNTLSPFHFYDCHFIVCQNGFARDEIAFLCDLPTTIQSKQSLTWHLRSDGLISSSNNYKETLPLSLVAHSLCWIACNAWALNARTAWELVASTILRHLAMVIGFCFYHRAESLKTPYLLTFCGANTQAPAHDNNTNLVWRHFCTRLIQHRKSRKGNT